jgi:hypothetical protein
LNIAVDAFAFVAFLLAAQPERTGVLYHERIGLAVTATLVIHLLLHRAWVASVVRRFLGAMARASRINLVVDALMGLAAATIAITGVALSETLLRPLGIAAAHGGQVLQIHAGAGEILTILTLAHLVLHRAWIARAARDVLAVVFWPVLAPIRWMRAAQSGAALRTGAVRREPRQRERGMAPEQA